MLPAGKQIKRDSTSDSGEECRSSAVGGRAHFSLQLGNLSPEEEAGAVRSMWEGRSGGQRKKGSH